MSEPERSIEEMVEEAFDCDCIGLAGCESCQAKATLLRAVARLRERACESATALTSQVEENERLAVLAAMQLCELGKVPDPRGTAWPVMAVEQARQVLADYAAPTPKGGDRE